MSAVGIPVLQGGEDVNTEMLSIELSELGMAA